MLAEVRPSNQLCVRARQAHGAGDLYQLGLVESARPAAGCGSAALCASPLCLSILSSALSGRAFQPPPRNCCWSIFVGISSGHLFFSPLPIYFSSQTYHFASALDMSSIFSPLLVLADPNDSFMPFYLSHLACLINFFFLSAFSSLFSGLAFWKGRMKVAA